MRVNIFLIVLLWACIPDTVAQNGSFIANPQFPQKGETISFNFNPGKVLTAIDKPVECVAYFFNEKGNTARDINLTKTPDGYKGIVKPDSVTRAIAFAFTSGEKKLNSSTEGQVIMIYDSRLHPVPGAYNAQAQIYNNWGNYLMGIERQPELALQYAEKEYNNWPDQQASNRDLYFQLLNTIKKKEATPLIQKELDALEAKESLSENDYQFLSTWYPRVQQKEKGDSISGVMKIKFPEGAWKKNEMLTAFYKETDPENLEKMYNGFTQKYPVKEEADKSTQQYMLGKVAQAYASAKDKKDMEKFRNYMKEIPMESRSYHFNNLAWNLAEKDEDLVLAKELSAEATSWAKNEMLHPASKQPEMQTAKQWNRNRKYTYSMFADTYAFILYKLKDYKAGMNYAKEAVAIREKKDAEYNDRYALLLEKTAPAAQVKKELEALTKDGVAGKETRQVLKRTYVKLKGSDKGFDTYMEALNNYGMEKLKAELVKKMINQPAPTFRLVNLKGNNVDLKELKGKVVILDFWATWCGPCIASFPGMQKAVDKYKNDPNVTFLFIDTWEGADDHQKRTKQVTEFVDKNKYTFNVLYDQPDKEDPNAFVVVNDYKVNGIPTKFVIDHNGNIRFKSVGYGGNEEGLVQELSLMIQMAGTISNGSGTGKKAF